MPRRMIISQCLPILLSCLILVVVCSGCSGTKETITDKTVDNETPVSATPEIRYKKYEMNPDDTRLIYLNHPLFSFEYPEEFNLIDLNHMPDHPRVYDISNIDFLIHQYPRPLPEIDLGIRIIEPGFAGYNDIDSVFEEWISTANSNGAVITTGEKTVSCLEAYYIETSGIMPDHIIAGHLIYPEHQQLFRGVVFDYQDLIWSISLTWPYSESTPHEIDAYFDRILETFEILNTDYDLTHPPKEFWDNFKPGKEDEAKKYYKK